MKIFMTGASGYIGRVVAEALVAKGHDLTVLARDPARAPKHKKITPLEGELGDRALLDQACRAADTTVHCAITGDPHTAEADANMVEAMIGAKKPFVYTSGVWVLGDTGGKTVDEEAATDHPWTTSAWRVPHEERVLRARHGVVLRPGIVYGRGGGIPAMWIADAKARGAARVIGDGANHWPVVHVDRLAAFYFSATWTTFPRRTIWHLVGEHVVVRDAAAAASRGAGAGGKIETWPVDAACAELGAWAGALAMDQLVSADRARAHGWDPAMRVPSLLEDLERGSYVQPRA